MNQYNVTLTGITPLLLHADNFKFREKVKTWIKRPENKSMSVAGDDRSPAFTWIGYCYFNNGKVCMPSDNLMTLFRDAGKKVPTGKKGASFKLLMAAGLLIDQIAWDVETWGEDGVVRTVSEKEIMALMNEPDFSKHEEAAEKMGFVLFPKSAKIMKAKNIRVRPRFNNWRISGTITVLDDSITQDVLDDILRVAGMFVGCGDWRPGSPMSPGSWGKFTHVISPL